MLKKRVTIISVERERVVEIRWRGRARESLCGQCGREARMLTPEEAAVVVGIGLPGIYGLLEAGRLHFTKTTEGLVLVCLDSLGRLLSE